MEANIESRNAERACARNPRNNKKMAQRGRVIGKHQASRAMIVLPVADRPAKDDSAPMDVFIMVTRVIVRMIAHLANSSLLQCPVGFLAARVVAIIAVRPHFRAHRGCLIPASRALRRHPNSIHPSFSFSISISTTLKWQDIRVTHRPTRYLSGVRDPIFIRLQVLGSVPVSQAKVVVG